MPIRRTAIPSAGPMWLSGNHSSREDLEPSLCVIHYTGGSDGRRTAQWMRDSSAQRSAHFVGFRDGEGCQLVPLHLAAWHAGGSEAMRNGEMEGDVNAWSIGVELANHGLLRRDAQGRYWYSVGGNDYLYRGPEPIEATLVYDTGLEVHGWWEPYPEAQLAWLERLLRALREAGYQLELVGHEEIGMPLGRKTDPGPLFRWERFGRLHCERRTTAQLTQPSSGS